MLIAIAAATMALSLPHAASAQSITDMRGRDARPPAAERPPPGRHRDRPMADRDDRQERGARYRIQNGRMKISFRCADGEPAQDCADLLLQVLDRLQAGGASGDKDSRDDDRRRLYRDR
ncbi:hypothetical protein GV67_13090 [Pseudorhizobium pelagicum]|uniref:Uncharacterized protein n=2 Tax=Pseudorhizobium pelagicum TaxID=1509405 RepID=A0A922T730_9HYPH|nr:hypothetical protein GV67_13090 [Pseudorhizobium pelagicum]KEQ04115.1 hypothetical protein GV68_13705 [Pseudorhizobium pelagicum]